MVLRASVLLPLAIFGASATALGPKTYDYVVVGGGTSGVTIASRLAQNAQSVALIEAGDYYEQSFPYAGIPGADGVAIGSDPAINVSADWGFVTAPQAGANDREIHFARGKCLGGSSALNFMVYQRPTAQSMDKFAVEVGNEDYSFDNILPYYQKTVDFAAPNATARRSNATAGYEASAFTSEGGPLSVSYPNYAMPFSTWMERGMDAIGIQQADDFNSGSLLGYQWCASTIDPEDEHRSTSETAFLSPKAPSNLTIYKKTLAKRILFDDRQTAYGVLVQDGQKTETIRAAKEVILSAGAFQSPQLLMVSGVGPADALARHGIPVVSELAGVGQNMWDHPWIAPTYRVNVETLTASANKLIKAGLSSINTTAPATGILSNPLADFLAWEKIPESLRSKFSSKTLEDLAQFPEDWPEAEYLSAAAYIGNASNTLTTQPKDGYQYASILGILITPTSRGNVTLASADASDDPIINPNWLTTDTDRQAMIAIFKRLRQAFQSDAMAPTVIGEEYYPGPVVQSDAEILKYIQDNVMTLWHPAGTCKMGTRDDAGAVVDSEARVFGVRGLRVVDASALPFLPPGHPQSTCYMLAEKIADSILAS